MEKSDEMHPFTARLLAENAVFARYPIERSEKRVRFALPFASTADRMTNVWSLLRKNIGRDLSQVAFPVEFNDPLSMLQKTAEFLEFQHFLRLANANSDSLMRLAYIMAFFFAPIPYTLFRLRKPFNPLLGETYEYVEKDLRFVAEQISHHPPLSAFHGECDDFVVDGHIDTRTAISRSGFIVSPKGPLRVTLKRTGERFAFTRARTSLNNIIAGKMYLWYFGESVLLNETTGERFVLEYRPQGWIRSGEQLCEGRIVRADGSLAYKACGNWSEWLKIVDEGGVETMLFTRPDLPQDADSMYSLSLFCRNLNYLPASMLATLPPTDSRLRTDQRAYEHGDFELAAKEKARLEQCQRARRQSGPPFVPLWFDAVPGDEPDFVSNGKYFRARERGEWPVEVPDIFN